MVSYLPRRGQNEEMRARALKDRCCVCPPLDCPPNSPALLSLSLSLFLCIRSNMSPSATYPSDFPRVLSTNNTDAYDQTETPPAEQVATAIATEPRHQNLFSLRGGAVIGESLI